MADSEGMVDVTVSVGELVKGLKRVKEVIGKRSTLPIITFARFQAGGAVPGATLQGTDLERYLTAELSGIGITGGMACTGAIPVHPALTFLNALLRDKGGDKKEVHIQVEGRMVTLSVADIGSVQWADLPDVADFPEPPGNAKKNGYRECAARPIFTGLRGVVSAVADEDTRPVLTCVAVSNKAFAAADGFRLHIFEQPDFGFGLPEKCDNYPVLVPGATVKVLLKLFQGQEKLKTRFQVEGSSQLEWFQAGGVNLCTQLVQGTYPNFRQLIPAEFKSEIKFSSPVMVQRLDMVEQDTTIIRLEAATKEGERTSMGLSVNEDGRRWKLTMPATVEAADTVHIGFNRKYLREAVHMFALCTLKYVSPSSAALFTGDVEGLSTVVMPMFVQW